jgi:hypothetical protein
MTITVNPAPITVAPPVVEPTVADPVLLEVEIPIEAPLEELVAETPGDPGIVPSDPVFIASGKGSAPGSLIVDNASGSEDRPASVNDNNPVREVTAAKQLGVNSLLLQLREQLEYFDDPLQLTGAESFITKLNDMREALISETEGTARVVGNSMTVSAGFSIGYVIWLARSGVLLSGVLSSMPAWRFIDPLPVLAGLRAGEEEDGDESLESMVEDNDVTEADQHSPGRAE